MHAYGSLTIRDIKTGNRGFAPTFAVDGACHNHAAQLDGAVFRRW